jgi:hypothetical protein
VIELNGIGWIVLVFRVVACRVWEAVPAVLKVHPSALQQLGLLGDHAHTQTPSESKGRRGAQYSSTPITAQAIPAADMPQMKLVVSKAKTRTDVTVRYVNMLCGGVFIFNIVYL